MGRKTSRKPLAFGLGLAALCVGIVAGAVLLSPSPPPPPRPYRPVPFPGSNLPRPIELSRMEAEKAPYPEEAKQRKAEKEFDNWDTHQFWQFVGRYGRDRILQFLRNGIYVHEKICDVKGTVVRCAWDLKPAGGRETHRAAQKGRLEPCEGRGRHQAAMARRAYLAESPSKDGW